MSATTALANVVSYSLQVALLAVAGGLIARAMRLRAPGAMLAYWQGLLGLCLLLPVVQPWSSAAVGAGAVSWEMTAARTGASGARPALAPVLAAALVAGAILRLAWLALGLRRLARCRARARPLAVLPAPVADLPDRLGVRARFYVSVDVGAPATFGHRNPAVLLPPAFLDMAPEAQRAVAAHELLHVRRRDWAVAALDETVRAALWFHPAVHWLLGRIRLCREQVVDQEVVGRLADRRVYLEALLEVARGLIRTRPLPAALMVREGHLKNRIELLLEEVNMSRTRIAASLTAATMALLRHIPGSLLIVWDRLSAHRSCITRDFIAAQGERVWVEYLPGYAPELNPVEYIWGYWKQHALPNVCPKDYWSLGETARRTLKRMRRRPRLITAFWQQAELSF